MLAGTAQRPDLMSGDEELARLGLAQFISFFQVSAPREECVRQLVKTKE
jgi:hypothetical protein